MGIVYRADDMLLGLGVALKFLSPDVEGDPESLERLKEEVRIAREITHPFVCRVYDLVAFRDTHFLSMEHMKGDSLSAHLSRFGRFSRDTAYSIARQTCHALAAVHQKGILHRDLKPDNILFNEDGNIALTDFGLAATIGSPAQGGTAAYMAPELWQGADNSVPSDIYALGMVLYEVFVGSHPFAGHSINSWRELHTQHTPPPPSSLVPALGDGIDRIILTCLDKDPESRTLNADLVASELDALASTSQTQSGQARVRDGSHDYDRTTHGTSEPRWALGGRSGLSQTLRSLAGQNRWPTFLAVVAALLLLGLALIHSSTTRSQYQTVSSLTQLGVLAVPSEKGYRVYLDESVDTADLPEIWRHLSDLEQVEELTISRIKGFASLRPISHLEDVHTLSIEEMVDLHGLDSIEGIVGLEELILSDLSNVSDLGAVGTLENLRKLQLARLNKITEITELYKLRALEELVLSGMNGLSFEEIEALRRVLPELSVTDFDAPRRKAASARSADDIRKNESLSSLSESRVVQTAQIMGFEEPRINSPVRLPVFLEEAREAEVQGTVEVRARVNEEGRVEKISVLKGLPFGLTEASTEAIATWEFLPAQLDGSPVAVEYDLQISFVGKESGGYIVMFGSGEVAAILEGDRTE